MDCLEERLDRRLEDRPAIAAREMPFGRRHGLIGLPSIPPGT
jgi:hypothetical protein